MSADVSTDRATASRPTAGPAGGPGMPLGPELTALLRRLKLGKAVDTLPERLALARTNRMSHAEFLAVVRPMRPPAATAPAPSYGPAPPALTPRCD